VIGRVRTGFAVMSVIAAASIGSYSVQAAGQIDNRNLAPAASSPSRDAVPRVRLIAPADGAMVSGPTMLRADITPPEFASNAVFFVNGRETCRRSEPPFDCEWDAGATLASHQVRLVVNLRNGGRVVQTVRTASLAFAETVDVDVVQVTVTVTDDRGRYVKGLPKSAFRVFEDGMPQPISQFYADDAPLELVVALDMSSSMAPSLPALKRAVSAFLGAVPPHHRLTLLGFNDEVFMLLPRSADAAARASIVDTLSAWGMTSLYEAIRESATIIASRPGRKAGIVFTDGQDQGSRISVDEVEAALQSGDMILYMIGQGQGIASQPLKQVMDRLAVPTGGRTVSTTSISELHSAFGNLFDEMEHQYVLGYQAKPGPADDRWREISVKIDGDYRIRARQGYRKARQ
jgi:VWFA-related protein